jgi:hypothetical protein
MPSDNKMNLDKRVSRVLLFLAAAAITMFLSVVVDEFFFHRGVPTARLLLATNAFTGVLAGIAWLQNQLRKRQQLQNLEDRLQTISELNCQVRNVLGIVAFYGAKTSNAYASKVFSDGLDRMEWILRGVLTKWKLVKPQPSGPVCFPSMSTRTMLRKAKQHLFGRYSLASICDRLGEYWTKHRACFD